MKKERGEYAEFIGMTEESKKLFIVALKKKLVQWCGIHRQILEKEGFSQDKLVGLDKLIGIFSEKE